MSLDRVESLEIEHRLEEPVGSRIAIDRCHCVGAKIGADRRLAFERIGIGLPDQLGGHFGAIEALGHAMNDRGLQGIVMQDGRIDECCKLGLASRYFLRLEANPRPDRVHLVERAGGSHVLLGHDCLPHIRLSAA